MRGPFSCTSWHMRKDCESVFCFCSSRRRHTRCYRDWSSDVCSSDLDEVCGCRNKWRGSTWGPRGRGARPRGVGAPWTLVARWGPPLVCSQCQIFLNILQKIIFHFRNIWRTFIFGVFFYCKDNSENRQKILFLL